MSLALAALVQSQVGTTLRYHYNNQGQTAVVSPVTPKLPYQMSCCIVLTQGQILTGHQLVAHHPLSSGVGCVA